MDKNPYESVSSEINETNRERVSLGKRLLRGFLIFSGIIVVLIIILIGFTAYQTSTTYSKFDGRAEPFITSFLESQNPWDYHSAKSSLSSIWLEDQDIQNDIKLFSYYNKLGSLSEILSIQWLGCSTFTKQSEGTINRCNYAAKVVYENGNAEVGIGLVLESDAPKIVQLRINSDAFMQ